MSAARGDRLAVDVCDNSLRGKRKGLQMSMKAGAAAHLEIRWRRAIGGVLHLAIEGRASPA